jgi:hypothetical protein
MQRAWIVVLGFILAGMGGLGVYFLPVAQGAANATSISDGLPNINPVDRPTQPFTVVVAPFDPDALTVGAPSTLVGDKLVASPAFSPDAKTIAFLAPAGPGGHFQLWTVAASGRPAPTSITSKLGFDSTSAPVRVEG